MKKALLTGLTAAMISGAAFASEVGVTTTFTSATPALASEVNDNFTALINAINDNNARIAALEAASGSSSDLLTLLTGAMYRVQFSGHSIRLGTQTDGSQNQWANNEMWAGAWNLTLNADMSALLEFQGEEEVSISPDGFGDCNLDPSCPYRFWNEFTTTAPGQQALGSWSLTGNELTVTWSDPDDLEVETIVFQVPPGAQMITLFDRDHATELNGDGSSSVEFVDTSIAIGVRQ